MDDTPLLKIEHDVCQLVGVLHNLVRRQTILWRMRGDVSNSQGELFNIILNKWEKLAISHHHVLTHTPIIGGHSHSKYMYLYAH